jgi:hypothetical protein
MKRNILAVAVVSGLSSLFAAQAQAGLITFENLTANSELSAAAGETQLFADVQLSPSDPDTLMFSFLNIGGVSSSIKSVHFDDDLDLLDDLVAVSGAGASFSADKNKSVLPGGNTVDFTTDFSLTADAPAPFNGVNPGDTLHLFFSLEDRVALADVVAALERDDLRLGLHVISFPNGQSESFVSSLGAAPPPPQQVSEPGVIALMGMGLVGLAAYRRRR